MGSQITHIVYGKKIFDRIGGHDWHDFVIGTVFPDIRYIAKLKRDDTHIYNTSEDQIPRNNSFNAGFYTHCFVDEKRESLLASYGLYNLIPRDYLHVTAVQLLEDTITYPLFNDWKSICQILKDISEEEKTYGVSHEVIRGWHDELSNYMEKGPSEELWESLLTDIEIPSVTAKQIATLASSFTAEEKICDMIREVYKAI